MIIRQTFYTIWEKGYDSIVELLIINGANIFSLDELKHTPLTKAKLSEDELTIKILMDFESGRRSRNKNCLNNFIDIWKSEGFIMIKTPNIFTLVMAQIGFN